MRDTSWEDADHDDLRKKHNACCVALDAALGKLNVAGMTYQEIAERVGIRECQVRKMVSWWSKGGGPGGRGERFLRRGLPRTEADVQSLVNEARQLFEQANRTPGA